MLAEGRLKARRRIGALLVIILPVVLLAVAVGVVLAALDGPCADNKALADRVSVLLVAVSTATMAAGGALVMRDWLLG